MSIEAITVFVVIIVLSDIYHLFRAGDQTGIL